MPVHTPRIAFVIDDLGIGGAQKQLALLALAIRPAFESHVYVLSSITEPHTAMLRSRGVSVHPIRRRSGADIARLVALTRAARDADVVHGFLDASNAYAFIAARLARRPVVLFLSSDRIRLRGWRKGLYAWMLRRAEAVTVNSRAGAAFLIDRLGVAGGRVVLVPNIVEVPSPPAVPAAPAGPVAGCVGRLAPEKRFGAVVEAFAAVRRSVPGARLRIVGDGPLRHDLEAAAARAGVAGAVTFAGAVDRPLDEMAAMSCLVVPSAYEGLPNAALEALSLGLPVVAAPAGDLGSIVIDGVTGVAVADTDPASLATAIARALTDSALRETAKREGPRLVRERFSEARASRALVALYTSLRKRNGAPPR